ncbi:hypothetical protein Tco_0034898 [Tanacetum coccineum]
MAYFVAILTPNSARSCVMQCILPTEGMRSIISTISISLKDFLPFILLLMVIIVAVVIVTVVWVVVVVDVIVGVVIVVAIIGVVAIVVIIRVVVVVVVMIIGMVVIVGVSFILKLSFIGFLHRIVIYPPLNASISFLVFGTMFGHKTANSWNLLIGQYLLVKSLFNSVQAIMLACSIPMGWAYAFHQDKASSVRVPVANVTLFSLAHLKFKNKHCYGDDEDGNNDTCDVG